MRHAGMRGLFTLAAIFGWAGCQSPPKLADGFSPALVRLYVEATDGGSALVLPRSGVKISVGTKAVFTEGDIVNAEEARVELGECLMLQLTPAAARDLYRLSVVNQGRRLVLTVNDVPLGARRIDGPLADGTILFLPKYPTRSYQGS